MFRLILIVIFPFLTGCIPALEPWNYKPGGLVEADSHLKELTTALLPPMDKRISALEGNDLKWLFAVLPGATHLDFHESSPFLTTADANRSLGGWEARYVSEILGWSLRDELVSSSLFARIDYDPASPQAYPLIVRPRLRDWSWKRRHYPYLLGVGSLAFWMLGAPVASWEWGYAIELEAFTFSGNQLATASAETRIDGFHFFYGKPLEINRVIKAFESTNQKLLQDFSKSLEAISSMDIPKLEDTARRTYCQKHDPQADYLSKHEELESLRASRCVFLEELRLEELKFELERQALARRHYDESLNTVVQTEARQQYLHGKAEKKATNDYLGAFIVAALIDIFADTNITNDVQESRDRHAERLKNQADQRLQTENAVVRKRQTREQAELEKTWQEVTAAFLKNFEAKAPAIPQ
ncbi:MAG: hypothetical protein AB1405_00500 [Bdellovibrionota bacterium]